MGLLDSDSEALKEGARIGSGRKVGNAGLGAFKRLSKYSNLTAKYREKNPESSPASSLEKKTEIGVEQNRGTITHQLPTENRLSISQKSEITNKLPITNNTPITDGLPITNDTRTHELPITNSPTIANPLPTADSSSSKNLSETSLEAPNNSQSITNNPPLTNAVDVVTTLTESQALADGEGRAPTTSTETGALLLEPSPPITNGLPTANQLPITHGSRFTDTSEKLSVSSDLNAKDRDTNSGEHLFAAPVPNRQLPITNPLPITNVLQTDVKSAPGEGGVPEVAVYLSQRIDNIQSTQLGVPSERLEPLQDTTDNPTATSTIPPRDVLLPHSKPPVPATINLADQAADSGSPANCTNALPITHVKPIPSPTEKHTNNPLLTNPTNQLPTNYEPAYLSIANHKPTKDPFNYWHYTAMQRCIIDTIYDLIMDKSRSERGWTAYLYSGGLWDIIKDKPNAPKCKDSCDNIVNAMKRKISEPHKHRPIITDGRRGRGGFVRYSMTPDFLDTVREARQQKITNALPIDNQSQSQFNNQFDTPRGMRINNTPQSSENHKWNIETLPSEWKAINIPQSLLEKKINREIILQIANRGYCSAAKTQQYLQWCAWDIERGSRPSVNNWVSYFMACLSKDRCYPMPADYKTPEEIAAEQEIKALEERVHRQQMLAFKKRELEKNIVRQVFEPWFLRLLPSQLSTVYNNCLPEQYNKELLFEAFFAAHGRDIVLQPEIDISSLSFEKVSEAKKMQDGQTEADIRAVTNNQFGELTTHI
jgi:hypothetical protein